MRAYYLPDYLNTRTRARARARTHTLFHKQVPLDKQTHWKQTALYLAEPVLLQVGDTISGKIHCQRREQNARHLNILLEYSLTKSGGGKAGDNKFQNYSLC